MHVVIVGAGAMGRLFGGFLSHSGNEVTFVDPDLETVASINEKGLGIMALDAESPDQVFFSKAQAVSQGNLIDGCDLVLIAVKSYHTLTAIKGVAHLVSSSCPVLSLQTGLGNIETIEKIVPREHILGGYTFMAATALGPGVVRHGGVGTTYIGEMDGAISPRVEAIAKIFKESGLVTKIANRIEGRLWCKVIIFSAINPVSAILRVKNGELLENMESVTLMKRLIDEGKAVAEALAVDIVYHDLYELLFDTCKRTSDNLSSMLQDFLNGKKTEIDNQNGELCRYGRTVKVELPTHHTIIQIVKLLEMKARGEQHAWLE